MKLIHPGPAINFSTCCRPLSPYGRTSNFSTCCLPFQPGIATGWPSGLKQCVQAAEYFLASHGIIDITLQRVTNAVTQRLSSIPSTNIPQLLPPCMKPLSRQHPMQYPGTKLMGQLILLPLLWRQPALAAGNLRRQHSPKPS